MPGHQRRSTALPSLLLSLLLLTQPQPSSSLWPPGSLTQLPTLISLAHSLLLRVANARITRGDVQGSNRIRAVAEKLQLVGRGGGIWSLGWDFLRNYGWRDLGVPMEEVGRTVGEIAGVLRELGGLRSDGEKISWGARNYGRLKSLFVNVLRPLQRGFSRSGPLHEIVMILEREVVQGELLRDCLDVGAKDLEGLATITRDLFFSHMTSSDDHHEL